MSRRRQRFADMEVHLEVKNEKRNQSLVYCNLDSVPSPSIISPYSNAANTVRWEKDEQTGDQFISYHKLLEVLQSLKENSFSQLVTHSTCDVLSGSVCKQVTLRKNDYVLEVEEITGEGLEKQILRSLSKIHLRGFRNKWVGEVLAMQA